MLLLSPIIFIVFFHRRLTDESVPWEFSQSLNNALLVAGKTVEYYTYEGADHNLSGSAFGQAMTSSVKFFDEYLK